MRAESRNLQRIFDQTIVYRIPLFQRPYVWDESENWEPIWADIRMLAERRLRDGDAPPHFLGAIVLDQLRSVTGSIETRQVIDGQQRLTTLQILLAALRSISTELGAEKYAQRFAKLTSNDESFRDSEDDEFKVWPTNTDRKDYRATLRAESASQLRETYGVAPTRKRVDAKIPDAYLYFVRTVGQWLTDDPEEDDDLADFTPAERLESLWAVVRGHLLIVVIDLDERDDAQVIFETLNARGTQLLPADLVKNYLFHKAELDEAPIERLYESYWGEFDEGFWRQEASEGRTKRPRIDLYLRHYLTLRTCGEVAPGHIFGTFKHYAESDGAAAATPEQHLKSLSAYGKIYRRFSSDDLPPRAALFFERLNTIDTATVYPLLLEAFRLFDHPATQTDLVSVLADLESYLVRRMVCGLTTKNYNRLFIDLIQSLSESENVSADGVRDFLLRPEGDSVRWPDDDEFRRAFVHGPMYQKLSRLKCRMVLEALDRGLEDGKSETIAYTSKLTIEHLLPQEWHANWPLPEVDGEGETERAERHGERDRILHTVGNLTLLTDRLNPSVSNGGWERKRPEILRHSKLNLNRRFLEQEAWGEADIAARAEELFEVACQIWPSRRD